MRLSREDATEGIGSVGTVAEAVAMYDENQPDVIVTDLQLEDGTGSTSSARSVPTTRRSGWSW